MDKERTVTFRHDNGCTIEIPSQYAPFYEAGLGGFVVVESGVRQDTDHIN